MEIIQLSIQRSPLKCNFLNNGLEKLLHNPLLKTLLYDFLYSFLRRFCLWPREKPYGNSSLLISFGMIPIQLSQDSLASLSGASRALGRWAEVGGGKNAMKPWP